MIENTTVNTYLSTIKGNLRCSKELRTKFLDGLTREISETSSVLEMNQHTLEETFGKPEAIAIEFLEGLSEEDRLDYGRRCKKRRIIAVAIITCIVLGIAIYLVDFYRGIIAIQPTEFIVTTTVSEPYVLSDEEIEQKMLEKELKNE